MSGHCMGENSTIVCVHTTRNGDTLATCVHILKRVILWSLVYMYKREQYFGYLNGRYVGYLHACTKEDDTLVACIHVQERAIL